MSFRLLFIIAICFTTGTVCYAQNSGSAEYRSPEEGARSLRRPKPVLESMERMRIAKDKKEYEEMMYRADELLRRSSQLENSVDTSGGVTERDKQQIAAIEKLAKQIRNQLGGDDDDDESGTNRNSMSSTAAVKSLKSTTSELIQQLKKTSRFTVSAAAIQSSNEVLRIARYLKASNNN